MKPIGFVKCEVKNKKDESWGQNVSSIILNEDYFGGLKGLEDFSHAIILYYLVRQNLKKKSIYNDDHKIVLTCH